MQCASQKHAAVQRGQCRQGSADSPAVGEAIWFAVLCRCVDEGAVGIQEPPLHSRKYSHKDAQPFAFRRLDGAPAVKCSSQSPVAERSADQHQAVSPSRVGTLDHR